MPRRSSARTEDSSDCKVRATCSHWRRTFVLGPGDDEEARLVRKGPGPIR